MNDINNWIELPAVSFRNWKLLSFRYFSFEYERYFGNTSTLIHEKIKSYELLTPLKLSLIPYETLTRWYWNSSETTRIAMSQPDVQLTNVAILKISDSFLQNFLLLFLPENIFRRALNFFFKTNLFKSFRDGREPSMHKTFLCKMLCFPMGV